MLQDQQRSYVRELVRQCAELAGSEEYELRRRRWRDVNALRRGDRAPVYCRPVGCWGELLPDRDLRCDDPFLRGVERNLLMHLIKDDIGDDSLIPPYWPVRAAFELDGEHTWGVEIKRTKPNSAGGSWKYDPPIRQPEDLKKLRAPTYFHDEAATARRVEEASRLLGDILPVRVVAGVPLHLNLATHAAELLGMDALLLDLAMNPRMVHELMAFLRDGCLRAMDWAEGTGLLTENNDAEMYCSDSLKTSGPDEPVRIRDLWAAVNGQEFDAVSPDMTREFLIDYYRPILARHGLCGYGCCEDLTHKIAHVLSIENLRIFVCSAWTDLDKVIEAVGDRYTIMWRQKATDVVYAGDIAPIRAHLMDGMKRTEGLHRQIVLRELQTLNNNNPQRLHEWSAAAIEAAETYG